MRQKIKAGSPSLFFMIQCINALFGICALALIALSIWLWKQFNTFSIIELVFLLLGIVEFLLVMLVVSAKKSVAKLRCFLFVMSILFLAQIVAVIVIAATGDSIVKDIAKDSASQIDKLQGYLHFIIYYTGACLVIMLLEILCVKCYIGSLRQRNNQFDYKYLDTESGKLTLDQKKQKDRNEISQKYNKKRQELAQKYAGFQPQYS